MLPEHMDSISSTISTTVVVLPPIHQAVRDRAEAVRAVQAVQAVQAVRAAAEAAQTKVYSKKPSLDSFPSTLDII